MHEYKMSYAYKENGDRKSEVFIITAENMDEAFVKLQQIIKQKNRRYLSITAQRI